MGNQLAMEAWPVPLKQTENGTWRIAATRIPLERLVECYQDGYSPEEIVEAFDVLKLSDVYHVLAYYLDHKELVDEYLREQGRKADEVLQTIDASKLPRHLTRDELLARRARMEQENGQARI